MKFRIVEDEEEIKEVIKELQTRFGHLAAQEANNFGRRCGRSAMIRAYNEMLSRSTGVIVMEESDAFYTAEAVTDALEKIEGTGPDEIYFVKNVDPNTVGIIISTAAGCYFATTVRRIGQEQVQEHTYIVPSPAMEGLISIGSYNYFETWHVLKFGGHFDSILKKFKNPG